MKEAMLETMRKERDSLISSIQEGNERKRSVLRKKIVNQIVEGYREFELDPEDTNRIYLCRGKNYFGILKDGIYQLDIIGSHESVKCGWYCNIESEIDNYLIPIEECDEFEKNHYVIFHDNFEEVQSEFIINAVNHSQESAVKMLLKKYK